MLLLVCFRWLDGTKTWEGEVYEKQGDNDGNRNFGRLHNGIQRLGLG